MLTSLFQHPTVSLLFILLLYTPSSLATDDSDPTLPQPIIQDSKTGNTDLIQEQIDSVLNSLAQEDYDKAIEAASQLVAKLPDNTLLHNLLGLVYMAGEEYDAARREFEIILKLEPISLSAQLHLARLDIKAGKTLEAEARYLWILKQDPKHLDALLGLAELADQAKRSDEALSWLEQAWASNPDSVSTGLILLQRYLERDNKLKALSIARDLHLDDPNEPTGLRAFGLALLANGEIDYALKYFRKLAALVPESPEVWHLIATTLIRTQDYAGAGQALDKALKAQDDYLPSLMVRTQLYLLDKHYKKALAYAHRIQARHPEQNAGYKLEGDVHMARQDFSKAVTAYRSAYDKAASAQLTLLLAHAQRLIRDAEGALKTLREWLIEHPEDSHIRTQLAMYLERMQQPNEAIIEYERIVEQEPENAVVLNNLAWLYHIQNDPRSIEYGERALKQAPDRPEISDTLGWILVQNGQLQRGLELLQHALSKAPQIPDIRYHLAVAYEKQGRIDEAREELQRLLDGNKVFADADKAKVLLQQLE